MKLRSEKNSIHSAPAAKNTRLSKTGCSGFTLLEVVTALIIIESVALSVIIIINRCISSITDSQLQMQAFEVARENMEQLLCKTTVEQTSEYGVSEKYPGIEWTTVIETFFEPITSRTWLRGVCSASYYDSKNQEQKVELTHWLSGLSTIELLQIMWQQEAGNLAEQIFQTAEQAARYAGVDTETIEEWLDNGLVTTEEGFFIKSNIDLFIENNGRPDQNEIASQIQSLEQLQDSLFQQAQLGWRDEVDPQTGLTYGELENMNVLEIWQAIEDKRKQ